MTLDRMYIEAWTLSRAGDPDARVYLWDGGQDVTVQGGNGEGFSFDDPRPAINQLLRGYEADGWAVVHEK